MLPHCIKTTISEAADVGYAALDAKNFARDLEFSISDQYIIATAVSELAQNMFKYANFGHISLICIENQREIGIKIIAQDSGPGIEKIDLAMQDRFSTGGTLGVGLPGTKRLMDDFHIESVVGSGTKVVVKKWRK